MDTVTSADGVTIAYESSGSGPALVIVNGAAALAADGRRDEAVERFMQGNGLPEAMIEQMKASPVWPSVLRDRFL